ncbi:hypothetical protein L3Y34_019622 [Caenorhabditis briggsae]|uniref:MATH domain-containing protein n=1 Tax=Caenorhabditis briggsae TaxID=6238 RepID=A0AAE9DPR4_CAEBR|nr:hypothetical protein L3Y34_019622 [Caenorhabditis briggsae]
MTEREFTLKHIFTDVEKLENRQNLYSPQEEHFGVEWYISIKKLNEHLGMFLWTNVTGNQEIHTNLILRIFSKNREKNHSKSSSYVFGRRINPFDDFYGWYQFIEWRTLQDEYLDDGKLEVEVHVNLF